MDANDIKIVKNPGLIMEVDVDDRTTSSDTVIYPGEPVKKSTNFATHVATGDPEVGTDEFLGIAKEESTESSTADGKVELVRPVPNWTVFRGTATTSTNVNTAAKLLGLKFDWVCFDVTGTVYTIDENETDDPNVHALQIIDGDYLDFWLDVLVHSMACTAGPYY